MSMNPFCEIALEEAVRMKEKKLVSEIIAVSIGSKPCQETLRTAFAIGADKGIHINTDLRSDQDIQPLAVAKVMKYIAEREKVNLVIVGKQSIDGDNCQTGQMLAALLGWPQCTFASKLLFSDDKSSMEADRETDTGSEKVKITLPAVVSADLRLNEPRYATLPNIMKAKKKPIEVLSASELGLDLAPQNIIQRVEDPPVRKAGIFVSDVDQLLDKLRNEAAVIKG